MEITLSNIADICGILGFIFSLFALGGVIRINKKINSNNVSVSNSPITGDFTGRDKITNL
ncbi:MAG: hypothetical protein R3D58_15375 [Saprospiraceae bacterium]